MLDPIGEHELLLFWTQFTLLLVVARSLGHLFRRVGQPAVVGELAAGLLIGPSVFARVLPGTAEWLFPGSLAESAPILTVAWLGVALLLVETGFETDLALLRRLGKQAAAVSIGSLVVPLVLGFVVGWLMPSALFVGHAGSRFTFAAFIAVAMSISALPVVARILGEMDLMRRNIGQVTVAAAMVNDLVGWILLGILAGIVTSGGVDLQATAFTIAAIAGFFGFALTVGQRMTNTVLRVSRQVSDGLTGPLTVTMVVVLVAATITQAIGVEAVLGAFVAGIVIGRSPYQHPEVRRIIELLAAAVFAPIFFASAGIYVDLGAVASGEGLFWAVVVIAVATLTKLVGSYAGARLGGMPNRYGLAIGVGLNARGAMEIVLATIAFGLGVFSQDAYTIVVLMAIVTSLMAPPLLRRALRGEQPKGEEAQRLAREEILAGSVVASTSRALLPTRGGMNSRLAAEAMDLLLLPEAAVSVLTVHTPGLADDACRCDEAQREMSEQLTDRTLERRRVTSDDPAEAILQEAELGYGLVALGMTEEFRDTHELSGVLRELISRTRVPLLLVRGAQRGFEIAHTRRILVPATGVRHGRAAEEIGAVLATRLDAALDLVHVVARSDRGADTGQRQPVAVGHPGEGSEVAAQSLLDQAVERARRFGVEARSSVRTGAVTPEALLAAGTDLGSDLIVISTRSRAVEGRPFLGHGAEYLLEHAPQTVVAVIFPPEGENNSG
ncbi:cation:proton antiporter [Egicoccus sp. AB-alg6-2]|uniref:cation:proton antiporter domain-containing protein n=1 Tax=Egicoccus sp. AB-alg6-2 TaxID=3242692 RepID=UPI00359E4D78